MNKENILFGIIGILLGCIGGFVFANTVNQRGYTPTANTNAAPTTQTLPEGHPPTGNPPNAGGSAPGAQPEEIAARIKKAQDEPTNFDAQMDAAQLYYQIHRYPDAIELLKKAVALRPREFSALAALGNAYFDSENFVEAERAYRSALAINPTSVEVQTDLGTTFMRRNPPDPARAIQEYLVSIGINPNHEATLGNLARAYIQQKNGAQARATLDKLTQVNPNNPDLPELRTALQNIGG